jgi:ABC-type lipoprotein export system ATPase subunit
MAVLKITDLKKSFASPDGAGERTLVVDVPAFELGDAQQVALQGSSGSGKTTFLNLIAGILQADSGQIVIGGEAPARGGVAAVNLGEHPFDMASLPEAERDRLRATTIGYVFQTFNLLQGYTALENVLLGMMFGRGRDRARATELLERVGLSSRMHHKPQQLSVGQQQRVAVARALANRPKLVLADEPTGNLDHRNASEALALIRQACKDNGSALLLVSHDREVLAQFENVAELAQINRAAAETKVSKQ